MIRTRLLALSLLVLAACSCSHAPERTPESMAVEDLMSSTVRVNVRINGTLHTKRSNGKAVELPYHAGVTGSGVVIETKGGLLEPIRSLIVTANHVVEVPALGEELEAPNGDKLVVDEVLMTVDTYDGQTCNFKVEKLGVTDQRDVATGYADCTAGKPAKIADRVPPPGAKVLVTGHPDSHPTVIITEGYVSGWHDNYLIVSAPIFPGNSGGPLWYQGEVVGIMVRVDQDYMHIALSAPLREVWQRVADTP